MSQQPNIQIFKSKQQELKKKKQQNKELIIKIKQLSKLYTKLKWQIPEIAIHTPIQQLKQSTRIPLLNNSSVNQESIERIQSEISEQISKQVQNKKLQVYKHKKQLLVKLDKLKVERQKNYYNSHKRVILKQHLQKLRRQVQKSQQENQYLRQNVQSYDRLKLKVQANEKQLAKSTFELNISKKL